MYITALTEIFINFSVCVKGENRLPLAFLLTLRTVFSSITATYLLTYFEKKQTEPAQT